jgi:hypothetical protein
MRNLTAEIEALRKTLRFAWGHVRVSGAKQKDVYTSILAISPRGEWFGWFLLATRRNPQDVWLIKLQDEADSRKPMMVTHLYLVLQGLPRAGIS